MRTFKQKQFAYRDLLATLPLSGSERHRYAVAYSGHGPEPRHCHRCGRIEAEAHAEGCTHATAPLIARLCDECGMDLTEGHHGQWCSQAADAPREACAGCGCDLEDGPHARGCLSDPMPYECAPVRECEAE